jgi:hypothetical protein
MSVEETEEGGGIAGGFGEAEFAEVEVSIVEGEGEAGGDGGALRGGEAGAERVETAAQEKEKRFEGFEGVFEFLCDLEVLGRAVEGEEAVVFAVQDVVQACGLGAETFREPLAGESGEVSQGLDAPEVEEVGGGSIQCTVYSIQCTVFSIQKRERKSDESLNTEY